MAEDRSKIPQKVSVESNPPAVSQLADGLQQDQLRRRQLSEIRKSYVVHGRTA